MRREERIVTYYRSRVDKSIVEETFGVDWREEESR